MYAKDHNGVPSLPFKFFPSPYLRPDLCFSHPGQRLRPDWLLPLHGRWLHCHSPRLPKFGGNQLNGALLRQRLFSVFPQPEAGIHYFNGLPISVGPIFTLTHTSPTRSSFQHFSHVLGDPKFHPRSIPPRSLFWRALIGSNFRRLSFA